MTGVAQSLADLHSTFLDLLPRIELHATISFRHVRCTHRKADCIAESVAIAWKWFLRATEQGKDVHEFASTLARYAVSHVRSGRRLSGRGRTKDVLSPPVQQRYSFTVQSLPGHESGVAGNLTLDALADNTITPPPDQAAFRIDFPRWRNRHSERHSRIVDKLMAGERTLDVAQRHGLTTSRISQLRRELHDDWAQFCGPV